MLSSELWICARAARGWFDSHVKMMTHMHTHRQTCALPHIHLQTRVREGYVYAHFRTYTRTRVHTHTHTRVHTHSHTHIYTCTHMRKYTDGRLPRLQRLKHPQSPEPPLSLSPLR